MADVVVTLPKKEGGFDHLHDKIVTIYSENELAYWYTNRVLNTFDPEADKMFICADGKVHGFFLVDKIEYNEDGFEYGHKYLLWLDEWTTIKRIPMKGFRGMRYRKFKWEQDGGLCRECWKPTNYRECETDSGVWICKGCFEDE